MTRPKFILNIKSTDKEGTYELSLGGDSMNELVDKLHEWNDWYNQNFPNRRTEERERASGFYYFKDKDK
jgi:hypothetical protein